MTATCITQLAQTDRTQNRKKIIKELNVSESSINFNYINYRKGVQVHAYNKNSIMDDEVQCDLISHKE